MPDYPDFIRFIGADGAIWFIDRGMTRWEKVPIEHVTYPEGVTPAQVLKDLTEE